MTYRKTLFCIALLSCSLAVVAPASMSQPSPAPSPAPGPSPSPSPAPAPTGFIQTPQVVTPPPVVIQPEVRTPPPIVIIPTIPHTPINPLMVPLDVVVPIPSAIASVVPLTSLTQPINGISQLDKFPATENLKGPTDFILVQGDPSCYKRETPYMVNLVQGTVLASVKRPSQMGMLNTALGVIALSANSDAFITVQDGLLRIRNVDGMAQTLRVQLDKGPFLGKTKIFTIKPGYELVVGNHKLVRADLRPQDGILRRQPQLLEGGFVAISQYHVESALQQSAIVVGLNQKESDAKSRRVLSDMSRMAAVLNHVNGYDGYGKD